MYIYNCLGHSWCWQTEESNTTDDIICHFVNQWQIYRVLNYLFLINQNILKRFLMIMWCDSQLFVFPYPFLRGGENSNVIASLLGIAIIHNICYLHPSIHCYLQALMILANMCYKPIFWIKRDFRFDLNVHKSTEVCFTYKSIPLICITVEWDKGREFFFRHIRAL